MSAPQFDDGTRLTVDTDVVAQWGSDFDRIESHRHLRTVTDPPTPPPDPWRTVRFVEGA